MSHVRRLISRQAFLRDMSYKAPELNFTTEEVCYLIERQRAVDAEPVRHGKWLYVGYGKPDAWDCSECGVMVAKQHFYCPRCGAKMD